MNKIEPWKIAACLMVALVLVAGCAPQEEAEPTDVEVETEEEAVEEPSAEPEAVEPELLPEEAEEEPEPETEEAEPPPPAPAPLPVAEVAAAGKQVFLDQRCSTCHSVSTAGIEAKMTSGPTAGSDLAGVGERRDRAAIEAIVRQERTVGDGKKHPKGFTGSQEELEALLDWLAAQG